MMEQSDTGKAHRHPVFIACFNHIVVPDGAPRLRHIFYAALMGALDIIAEWEESV